LRAIDISQYQEFFLNNDKTTLAVIYEETEEKKEMLQQMNMIISATQKELNGYFDVILFDCELETAAPADICSKNKGQLPIFITYQQPTFRLNPYTNKPNEVQQYLF
jgi:hypothetical protein